MSISQIQELVCRTYGISRTELVGGRRRTIEPRQVAMWLAREMTPQSLPVIGRSFRRDHTTVMYAVEQIDARRRADPAFALRLGGLRRAFERFQDIELAEAKEDLAREIAAARAEMRAAA